MVVVKNAVTQKKKILRSEKLPVYFYIDYGERSSGIGQAIEIRDEKVFSRVWNNVFREDNSNTSP